MRHRFKTKTSESDQMTLQITSMADIFMIVLVFLLKSFSTSMVSVSPSAGLTLPQAHAEGVLSEALKIEISERAIQVEGKPVVQLANYHLPQGKSEAGSSTEALNEALSLERKRQILISAQNSEVKLDSKIMVIASQQTPYAVIKLVLASAAANGFSDFKLVVAKKE